MIETSIDDIDIIFISYDEPMKDQYWAKLLERAPLAKRVDGVTGFDAAHKQAAAMSETDRFVTVDGDTLINDDFMSMVMRYDEKKYGDYVFAWASENAVNGLVYGNGSLKCWPREATLNMQTHESTDDEQAKIEFCWSIPYLSMHDCYSTTHPATTPYHAFRAGFREGIKMALHDGRRVEPDVLFDTIWAGNAHNMAVWMSVGADHTNGLWSIYGARLGLDMINSGELDIAQVADYKWFPKFWTKIISRHDSDSYGSMLCPFSGTRWSPPALILAIEELGRSIENATGRNIPLFDATQSAFYKKIVKHHERSTPRLLFSS